jgi:hypothetical protein
MTRKLSIPQLITIETLHRKEYTLSGTVRKLPRTLAEDLNLGIPPTHRKFMQQCRWQDRGGSEKLRQLLNRIPKPQKSAI